MVARKSGNRNATSTKGKEETKILHCSFCGRSQHEVKKLIAGPKVYICNICLPLCLASAYENVIDAVIAVCEEYRKQKIESKLG